MIIDTVPTINIFVVDLVVYVVLALSFVFYWADAFPAFKFLRVHIETMDWWL